MSDTAHACTDDDFAVRLAAHNAVAAIVRRGDTLVMGVKACTAEMASRVKDYVVDRLPGVNVLVVESETMVVYRPDSATINPGPCVAKAPSGGYLCTREHGHAGNHTASNDSGVCLDAWSQ